MGRGGLCAQGRCGGCGRPFLLLLSFFGVRGRCGREGEGGGERATRRHGDGTVRGAAGPCSARAGGLDRPHVMAAVARVGWTRTATRRCIGRRPTTGRPRGDGGGGRWRRACVCRTAQVGGRGVVCPLEWRRRGRVVPPGAGLLRGDRLPPSWSRPINFFLSSPVGVVAHRPPAPRSSPVQVLPSQLRVATRSFVFFCRRGVWPPIAPAAGGGPTLPGVCRRTWRAPVVARAAQSPGRAGRRRRKGGGGVGGWGGLNSGRPSPAGRAICPPPKCAPKGPTPRRRQASHGPLS